ncbi:MBL fold metallo-hydrolase [Halioxenophilus aromaticivorans]|uniref:MBL fold metallo-hydrolase n=1 Tax=Halioxenophilus aromaticivorans TaxID=1306992 RepID=A0AAV3U254_9ALTE
MLKFRIIPVTAFQQNCSVLWCDQTKQTVLVDPGGDIDRIQAVLSEEGLTPHAIWLTHGHLDHVAASPDLARQFDVPIIGPHREDLFWLQDLPRFAAQVNFPPAEVFEPSQWLNDGDQLTLGNLTFDVLHCPGHTPGHVIFYEATSQIAFVGDLLFAGSVGRTDFPRGNFNDLVQSIRGKLWPLGDDVRFVPGHGPMSTFGHEKHTNPFVADKNFG